MCGPCNIMEMFCSLSIVRNVANFCTRRFLLFLMSLFAICANFLLGYFYLCVLSFMICICNVLYLPFLYNDKTKIIRVGFILSILSLNLTSHIIRSVCVDLINTANESGFPAAYILEPSGAIYQSPNVIIRLVWAVLGMIGAAIQSCLFCAILFEKKGHTDAEKRTRAQESRELMMVELGRADRANGMPREANRNEEAVAVNIAED